jgi:hypothetical protein
MPTGSMEKPVTAKPMPLSVFPQFAFTGGRSLQFRVIRGFAIFSLPIAIFSAFIARISRLVRTNMIIKAANWNCRKC